jgi:hypothetical protein
MSDSDTSITIIHLAPDQIIAFRDTSNDILDTSIASDYNDATLYRATDGALSDSDTLDAVSDIEFDDDIVDIKESDDDILNIIEIDNDIVDTKQ